MFSFLYLPFPLISHINLFILLFVLLFSIFLSIRHSSSVLSQWSSLCFDTFHHDSSTSDQIITRHSMISLPPASLCLGATHESWVLRGVLHDYTIIYLPANNVQILNVYFYHTFVTVATRWLFGSLAGWCGKGQVRNAEGVRFGSPRFSVSVTAAIIDVAVIVTQIPINTFIMVFSLLNDA